MSKSWPPELVKVTTCGKRVFVDIIKLRILRRSSWIRAGPKANDTCLYKRQKKRHRHGEEGHVQTEAEIGVDLTSNRGSATECQQPPEARREAWRFSLRASRKIQSCPHPDFRLLASIATAE